jgi:hypothetical protein
MRAFIFPPTGKKIGKTLISTVMWLFHNFLSLKTDKNLPIENNKQKN